ncbi:type II toxin-antitoxin system PrlF family antitoxin [Propionivibrio sp.]|uniref:type II toxin-antitoxin system PrlF family antitoxin n=1 Tax=Propionivibrio sp. TaxID=2212460 RepID=UPI003BF16891
MSDSAIREAEQRFNLAPTAWKSQPQFVIFWEVKATMIAPGQMLVSSVPSIVDESSDQEDQVMLSFLAFLEAQMTINPELITPISEAEMQAIAALVEGVEVD